MCGICGIINLDGSMVPPETLIKMRDIMAKRGPDDKGAVLINQANNTGRIESLRFQDINELDSAIQRRGYNIGMAHRRLSIIDLSPDGRQPMSSHRERLWITFNGEIYNFLELRQRLEARGHNFKTKTDTEAILHAYEEWGTDFVYHLRGMFAIAIWDAERSLCVLVRDRFGIKPLFYFWNGRHLVFASDIKSLMLSGLIEPEISPEAVLQYFRYHYIPAPSTIFKHVNAVLPAQQVVVVNGLMEKREYWQPCLEATLSDEKEAIDLVESGLKDAISLHLLADVPIGSFLSGGVDSSLVSLFAKEVSGGLKAYCIGFDEEEFDESIYARKVADHLGLDLHVDKLEQPPSFEEIVKIVGCCDQPFADSSLIPTYQVCKNARRYFPVALSGDGGDEVFAGYGFRLQNISAFLERHGLIDSVIERTLAAVMRFGIFRYLTHDLKRFLNFKKLSLSDRYFFYHTKSKKFSELVSPDIARAGDSHPDFIRSQADRHGLPNTLNGMLALCLRNNLPNDMLVKVDRASMANSLEVRVPFLDHRLVETAFRLACSLKQPGTIRTKPKYILKKIAEKNLPHDAIYRKKQGFSVPMGKWAHNKLHEYLKELFYSTEQSVFDFLNPKFNSEVQVMDTSMTYTDKWALFCFLIWYDNHQKFDYGYKRI